MTIITLLEQLAKNAHHKISIEKLISTQPQEVRRAFLTNDVASLKKQFGNDTHLADKSTIFQI